MTEKKNNRGKFSGTWNGWLKSPLHAALDSKRLSADVMLGIVIGINAAFYAISLINLIFTGPLSTQLTIGISIALLATSIVLITTSLFSTLPFGIGILQDGPIIIMAVLVSGYLSPQHALANDTLTATVLTSMVLGTLSVSLIFFVVGSLRWGEFVRFVPYPVIGGFLAGTGWLMTLGGLGIVLDKLPRTIYDLQKLVAPQELVLWVPAVVTGLTLFIIVRRSKRSLSFPFTLFALLAAFYLALLITGTSLDEAMSMGLFLGDLGHPKLQFISLSTLQLANWQSISGQAANFGILVGISLISFLLYLTSIEVTVNRDIDINRELQRTGAVNLLTGLTSGMIGYLSLSLSSLTYRNGTRSRTAGIIAGVVVALILAVGFSSLKYFPIGIVAGLPLFIGIDFLYEWTVTAWRRFSRVEYAVILVILVVIALTDFLIGVLVGMAFMIVMFVVSYSQVRTIQLLLTGSELQSNVDRNAIERRWLSERGDAIRILILRGFLFFGSANSIVQQLRDLLSASPVYTPRFIIIDFKNVTGMDTSAALSFMKIEHLANEHGITLVLTDLSDSQTLRLDRGGMTIGSESILRFPDLDRGLEWCEQQLLQDEQHPCDPLPSEISAQFAVLGFDRSSVTRLLEYLQPMDLKKGEYLIHKDDDADALYYIETGRVSVFLEQEDGEQIRLRSLTHGATVGEMGLYSGDPRSASVIADEATRVHRMSLESMELMTQKEPALLAAFHRWVAASLSERLAQKSRSIDVSQSR